MFCCRLSSKDDTGKYSQENGFQSKTGQAVGLTVETSLDELLTLIQKLMNIVIHSTIHLSYLKVTDYFTEIMCLGLQMKTTQDHSLSRRQIKFQTLLL